MVARPTHCGNNVYVVTHAEERMTKFMFDSYALEQANQVARKDLASYHRAREEMHREATKNLQLVPIPEVEVPKKKKKKKGKKRK